MSAKEGDELVFLPLGGSGEIGMNLNAYGYGPPDARKWIIVDLGVTFGGSDQPGVDIILPDPTYLEAHKEDILGIVLTHAHEDHIGAVPWLWPRFKSPIYATPFTAALVREKLRERGLETKAKIIETPLKGIVKLGPFEIDYVTLTHSIPEPNGLAIRTPLGLVWHTGDWKIDPDPLIGETTDEEALRKMRDEGVLAMVCDSTNVFVEEHTGSEADVRDELTKLFQTLKSRIAVAAFASNVARVQSGRAGGASRQASGLPGWPVHAARHRRRESRWRAARRHQFHHRKRSFSPAQEQGALSMHRQSGRTPRGAVADRGGGASLGEDRAGRFRRILLARHSRQ